MATTKCECGGTNFEIVKSAFYNLHNARHQYHFLQCSRCGKPVGVIEDRNISAMLINQNEAIKAIAEKLGVKVLL